MAPRRHVFILSGLLLGCASSKAMEKSTSYSKLKAHAVQTPQKLLSTALSKSNVHDVRQALLNGAKIKTKSKKASYEMPPFHKTAMHNNTELIQTLLIAPQGGPSQINDYAITRITSLIWSLKQLNFPLEIINKISAYDMIPSKMLIHFVPLTKLRTFKPYMDCQAREELVDALVSRHLNQHRYALRQKRKYCKKFKTPEQIAILRQNENAAILLNPEKVDSFKQQIRREYMRLLDLR